MSVVDPEKRYADTHEWACLDQENDKVAVIGISDHAQDLLGDLVYVELPEPGATFSPGDEAGVVESVKAASDVYCPVSGTVTEVNTDLEASPELINSDPYNDGWLFKIELDDPSELDGLLSPDGYESAINK